jgi:hypothetical protein
MYVDPFASMDSSPEAEYAEYEQFFRDLLPGVALQFQRDVLFTQLANGRPDVYLFDIGGMCMTDYSGQQRFNWCHEVARQVEDHPNTLFLPWSEFTIRHWGDAVKEFLPKLREAPNVVLFTPKYDDAADKPFLDKIRKWCLQ